MSPEHEIVTHYTVKQSPSSGMCSRAQPCGVPHTGHWWQPFQSWAMREEGLGDVRLGDIWSYVGIGSGVTRGVSGSLLLTSVESSDATEQDSPSRRSHPALSVTRAAAGSPGYTHS